MIPINDLGRHNQRFADSLQEAMQRVCHRGWYILGPENENFEREFAAAVGSKHCIAVANGTDALELALRAVGVTAGDRVVTVANAGAYTTIAIRAIGAHPLYIDVNPATLLPDSTTLSVSFQDRPKAAVVTHLYGNMAPMNELVPLLRSAEIRIVEDCAQAHGAQSAHRTAGSWGDASTFSFYPTKNLGALGDGGAVTTSHETIALELRKLRQYGWSRKYEIERVNGRNSRMDELQAAILLSKLPHLSGFNARRREIITRYQTGITHPAVRPAAPILSGSAAHLAVFRTPARASLQAHLKACGVATDIHYPIPDHLHPAYHDEFGKIVLPVTEQASREVFTLPCFPELTEPEVERVVNACNTWQA